MNVNDKMREMPMKRLLVSMSLPIMLSMLIQACYNIVDSMFVARYSEAALAAVSLSFPVQTLMIAVSVGTAAGVNALLSRRLGEKKAEQASQTALHGLFLALCSWIVFAAGGLFLADIFARAFTSSPDIAGQAAVYIRICTIFSFGVFVQIVMERIMQATGQAVYNMIMQGTGALINIVLDPILIFGWFGCPQLGIAGAAIATVTGQILAMVLGWVLIQRRLSFLQLDVRRFRFSSVICRDIYAVGFPAIIMSSISSIMTLGMNWILMPFSELTISVFSIYSKLQQFVFMPVMGMNSALIAIIGYNYGAALKERIVQAVRYSLIAAIGLMGLGMAVFLVFPQALLQLFSASEQMLQLGIPALRTISLSFVFAGISIVLCSVFQAMNEGMLSLWVSLGRQLVLVLPLAVLLGRIGGLDSLWWAFVIAEGLCMILAIRGYHRLKTTKIAAL